MAFCVRFLALIIITFISKKVYEKRRNNELTVLIIYFAIIAFVFLL